MTVRVRFAPSPTGFMHVGHLRAALPNVLLGLSQKGTLILRFEDSDFERNKPESEAAFFEDLAWLGFEFNEGPHLGGPVAPYTTVERADRGDYNAAVQKLMAIGRAYECFTSPEELDLLRKVQTMKNEPPRYDNRHRNLTDEQKAAYRAEGRQPVIRFRLDDNPITWVDAIRGEQTFLPENLGGDPVVIRSSGMPLFTFYGAVDDIAMNITHVIRGEDHVTNAAIQMQLYEALGATPPQFAHIALMLDKDGHKMSKRLGALQIRQLKEQGYLPTSILSYMASLGLSETHSPSATLPELSVNFSLSKCGKAPVRFDEDQLLHTNTNALHHSIWEQIKSYAEPFVPLDAAPVIEKLWPIVRESLKTLSDIPEALSPILYAPSIDQLFSQNKPMLDRLSINDKPYLAEALSLLPSIFNDNTFNEWINAVKLKTGRKGGGLYHPIRLALTGQSKGPELAVLLPIWGPQEVKSRLETACR